MSLESISKMIDSERKSPERGATVAAKFEPMMSGSSDFNLQIIENSDSSTESPMHSLSPII